jgi:hypothetical protein
MQWHAEFSSSFPDCCNTLGAQAYKLTCSGPGGHVMPAPAPVSCSVFSITPMNRRVQKKYTTQEEPTLISDQVNEWVGLQLLVGEAASICVWEY